MTTILAAIFVFGVLITVHEFGHFITAKMTGMRVDEFAIGFGPNIFQKKVGETLYSLRIIPLGGYNKIAGMDPEEPDSDDSFKSKTYSCQNVGYFSKFVNELSAADNFCFQYFYDQWYSKASRSAYFGHDYGR